MANATEKMIESADAGEPSRRDQSPGLLRLLLGIAALLAILAAVSNAGADVIELRSAAQAQGDDVRLRDVADLEGPAAEALGETVVAAGQDRRVTLADVRRVLDGAEGVNWAKLTLRGHAKCTISRLPDAVKPPVEPASSPAPAADAAPRTVGAVASNPVEQVDFNATLTVRSLIQAHLAAHAGADPHDITVQFSPGDEDTLDEAVGTDRVIVEPGTRGTLGRVSLNVLRYRDDRQVSRDRLTVEVSRRMLAVVAVRAIDRGATVQQNDVEVREVVVTDGRMSPITDPRDAWGKAASMLVRKDAVLCHEHVTAPIVVERNAHVTVRCISGAVVLKMVCTAMEAGSVDQVIEVRNESTRQAVRVRVTGPGQAVLLLDGADAAQATNDRATGFSGQQTAGR